MGSARASEISTSTCTDARARAHVHTGEYTQTRTHERTYIHIRTHAHTHTCTHRHTQSPRFCTSERKAGAAACTVWHSREVRAQLGTARAGRGRLVVLFNDILLVARPEGSGEHGGLVLGRGLIELLTVVSVEKPVVGFDEASHGLFALTVLPMRPRRARRSSLYFQALRHPTRGLPIPSPSVARPVVACPRTCRSAVSRG